MFQRPCRWRGEITESIGTYDGHRAQAARHTLLSNYKDAGRVCAMRPKGEAFGLGGHPPAQMTGASQADGDSPSRTRGFGFKALNTSDFFGFRFFGFHLEYGLITDKTYSRRQINTGTKFEVSHLHNIFVDIGQSGPSIK